jgi:hypothetical protein
VTEIILWSELKQGGNYLLLVKKIEEVEGFATLEDIRAAR